MEFHPESSHPEPFDRGFVIDKGDYDLAGPGRRLLPDDQQIPGKNPHAGHASPLNPERKEIAVVPVGLKGEITFQVLNGGRQRSGPDMADQGHLQENPWRQGKTVAPGLSPHRK